MALNGTENSVKCVSGNSFCFNMCHKNVGQFDFPEKSVRMYEWMCSILKSIWYNHVSVISMFKL